MPRWEEDVKRLKANDPSLTTLDLSWNSIGNDGAKAIAKALKVNTVLTTLYLYRNLIGNDGAMAIAEALKVNTVLTTLNLSENSIGNEGAKAIAEALKDNTVLTILDLQDNSIGDSLLNKIQRTVEINKHVPKPDNIDDNVLKCFRDLAAALILEETTHIGVDDIKARLKDFPDAAKVQDRNGNTLLHFGMKVRAPVEIINALLKACPEAVTRKANNDEIPLDCGLGEEKRVSLESIQAFVDKYPEAINSMKILLHLAIFRGEKAPEIEQIILKYPDSVAKYGTPNLQSPLLLALQQGDYPDFEVVRIVFENHPDATNTLDNETSYNPFTYCVSRLLQSIKKFATLDVGDGNLSFEKKYALQNKLSSPIEIWYKVLRLLCASLNDVGDLKQLCMLDTPQAEKVPDGPSIFFLVPERLGFLFWVLATNEFNPFNPDRTLPRLDLNQEPITNWTVLEILVDLGTKDAANIFFQIEEQLRGSEEQDQLEISIYNHSATKVASFQSIAQVEEGIWQTVANRAKLSKLPKLKEWGDKYGRFLGKYLIQEEKHFSGTCVVYFGTELNDKSENTKETNVALKFFKDRSAFLRELEKRDVIRSIKGDATQFVIAVRAAYTDSKKGLNASDYPRVKFECNQTIEWKRHKRDIEFNHLLVMERGGRNDLSDVISNQNIAGKDAPMVRSIAIQIAKCLQFLNEECNVMHGDVKARNFVSRGEGVGYAAIDFDNSALMSSEEAGQKRTSSGYLPPEQAAVEYYLREKEHGEGPPKVKASPQYDMWCFGVLLYYLCTGEQLFVMDVREEVKQNELQKIVNWSDEDCVKKVDNDVHDDDDWNPMKPLLKKLLKRAIIVGRILLRNLNVVIFIMRYK